MQNLFNMTDNQTNNIPSNCDDEIIVVKNKNTKKIKT